MAGSSAVLSKTSLQPSECGKKTRSVENHFKSRTFGEIGNNWQRFQSFAFTRFCYVSTSRCAKMVSGPAVESGWRAKGIVEDPAT